MYGASHFCARERERGFNGNPFGVWENVQGESFPTRCRQLERDEQCYFFFWFFSDLNSHTKGLSLKRGYWSIFGAFSVIFVCLFGFFCSVFPHLLIFVFCLKAMNPNQKTALYSFIILLVMTGIAMVSIYLVEACLNKSTEVTKFASRFLFF